MLIGIMLILILITPLQKIMYIASHWEMPVSSPAKIQEGDSSGELEAILSRGEELFREKMKSALDDYQGQIFALLEDELAREFNRKLLQLRVVAEDDPNCREFGMLRKIYVALQAQEPDSKKKSPGVPGEIRVSVNVASPNLKVPAVAKEPGETEETGDDAMGAPAPVLAQEDEATEIAKYLAAYFRLPSEDVEVEILP